MSLEPFVRLGLALVICANAACTKPAVERPDTADPVPVVVEAARRRDLRGVVSATGVVKPTAEADWIVTAPAPGRILELPKAEGDPVQAGELLVRLELPGIRMEVSAAEAELTQAEGRLENATKEAERLSGLHDRGLVPRQDVENAQRELVDAEAAVRRVRLAREATANLEARTTVRARFQGVIATRWHNPGDVVEPGSADPILRVIDPARLEIVAAVPTAEVGRVVAGNTAQIVAPDQGISTAATVVAKPAATGPTSSTAEVRLVFSDNTTPAAGTQVLVDILAEDHRDVVTVPAGAVVRDGGATFVFLVTPDDNRAHRRAVTVGLMTRESAEILTGVQAGDRVIVQGQVGLSDGALISVFR